MTGRRWNVYAAELVDTRQAESRKSTESAKPCARCGRPTRALSGNCTRGDCLAFEIELLAEARAAFSEGRSAYDPEHDKTSGL